MARMNDTQAIQLIQQLTRIANELGNINSTLQHINGQISAGASTIASSR